MIEHKIAVLCFRIGVPHVSHPPCEPIRLISRRSAAVKSLFWPARRNRIPRIRPRSDADTRKFRKPSLGFPRLGFNGYNFTFDSESKARCWLPGWINILDTPNCVPGLCFDHARRASCAAVASSSRPLTNTLPDAPRRTLGILRAGYPIIVRRRVRKNTPIIAAGTATTCATSSAASRIRPLPAFPYARRHARLVGRVFALEAFVQRPQFGAGLDVARQSGRIKRYASGRMPRSNSRSSAAGAMIGMERFFGLLSNERGHSGHHPPHKRRDRS